MYAFFLSVSVQLQLAQVFDFLGQISLLTLELWKASTVRYLPSPTSASSSLRFPLRLSRTVSEHHFEKGPVRFPWFSEGLDEIVESLLGVRVRLSLRTLSV